MYILTGLWMGLVGAGLVGENPILVCLVLAASVVGLALVGCRRLRMPVMVIAFAVIGVLRSPEASWNRLGPAGDTAAHGLPVVLGVRTPCLAAACSDRAVATVEQVLAGPKAILGRRVQLRGLDKLPAPGGSVFSVCGKFSSPRPRLNPYGIDGKKQSQRIGIVGAVDVASISSGPRERTVGRVSSFRERLETLIRSSYRGEASGMVEAMLLGQRERLTPRVQNLMLKAGTYHVISVSGLHVGIVLLVFSCFLSVLGLTPWLLASAYAIVIVAYVVFTGSPPSAVRAGGLFLVLGIARLLQWRIDFPNCVCATGAMLLLIFPHFAWDIGFHLSLGAVLGMAVLVPQIGPQGAPKRGFAARAWRYVFSGFAVCLAAQAFTLPIVLYDFGRASLVAPIANLVMVPLTTLAIAGGIEASFALILSERLALVLLKASAATTHLSILATGWLTHVPYSFMYPGRPCPVRMVAYFAGLGALSFLRPLMSRRAKFILLATLQGLMVIPPARPHDGLLRLTFIYVGDGDAVLVETPDGKTTLVDAGPNTEIYGQAQNQVIRLIAMKGINFLSRVVVTHAHDDHYGGLACLLDNIRVGEIMVGDLGGEREYVNLLEGARARGVPVRPVRRGEVWLSGRAVFEVLHPAGDAVVGGPGTNPGADAGMGAEAGPGAGLEPGTDDANGRSVVVRLEYGSVSFLLTGDATPDVQTLLPVVTCTVLKAPHHGAFHSIDPGFLEHLGAKIAVVSAGYKFGSHPSPATLAMLAAAGIETLTTSADGAVTIVTDGASLEARSESGSCLSGTP